MLNGSGEPITQASQTPLNSPDQLALHTYGSSFKTQWITIHDTATDGDAPFNANALAKAKDGTPFKRPENGDFRPGSDFREFFFDETGDTNATSPENDSAGGWTSVWKLTQKDPSADHGRISIFYKGDQAHAGFDNVDVPLEEPDHVRRGRGRHAARQRNALDSGYVLDVTRDYSKPWNQPLRWLAEGRDASATIDSANGGFGKNEGDNEITGVLRLRRRPIGATGSSERRCRGCSMTAGAGSTHSSTATTRPTRSSPRTRGRASARPPPGPRPGGEPRARGTAGPWRARGRNLSPWRSPTSLCTSRPPAASGCTRTRARRRSGPGTSSTTRAETGWSSGWTARAFTSSPRSTG